MHKAGEPFPSEALLTGGPTVEKPRAELIDMASCTKADLKRVASKLTKSTYQNQRRFGAVLRNVIDGVSFADSGGRDDTAFRLCYYLARELPETDPESVATYFGPSIEIMQPTKLTVEKIASMVERQQEVVRQELEAAQDAKDQADKRNIWQAFAHQKEDRDWPYTEQELVDLADSMNTDRDGLRRMWVIQKGQTYWLLTPRGYVPYTQHELGNAARVALSPAKSDGVSLFAMKNNAIVLKTPSELVRDYGTVADGVHTHLEISHSQFDDRTGIFHEACRPVRHLEPLDELSQDFMAIDKWIRALGAHDTIKLKKWIYWCTTLRFPCVALFITGAPGAGKNLLASGLARLWGGIPTPLKNALSGFNSGIMDCPLLLADEEIPKDFKGNVRTEELREVIQASSRPLQRKYMADSTMHGAIRLIMAGNNEQMLQFKGQLSENDLLAISERILHINATKEATKVLQALGHGEVRRWVEQDLLARYAVTLQHIHQNDFEPEGRFLIKAGGDMVYRALAHGGIRFDLIQWLVSVLMAPRLAMTVPGIEKLIHVSKGCIYVHREAVEATWESYCKRKDMPKGNLISRELSNLGARTKIPGTTVNGYRIDLGHIKSWIEREGTCDYEKQFLPLIEEGIEFGKGVEAAPVANLHLN